VNRDVIAANLVKAVKAMRKEQKAYFATKQPVHLFQAKKYEQEVDQKIVDFEKYVSPQINQEKLL
jgi:hypothetical protein